MKNVVEKRYDYTKIPLFGGRHDEGYRCRSRPAVLGTATSCGCVIAAHVSVFRLLRHLTPANRSRATVATKINELLELLH